MADPYQALATLIATHPQWPDVSNEDLVIWVNEKTETIVKGFITSAELLATIVNNRAEFNAMSAANKTILEMIRADCVYSGIPTTNGHPVREVLEEILGTQTKQALANYINESVSRSRKAGGPLEVKEGDIEYARTL